MTVQPDPKRMVAAACRTAPPALRMLVVEDSEVGLELTCMMAQRLGAAVDGAADGHQAVQLVKSAAVSGDPYALVLMDFMMPIVDGIEATRRIRAAGITANDLPVVALTAIVEPGELARFTQAGGQAYLAKPISLEKMSAVLDAWVPERASAAPLAQVVEDPAIVGRYVERKRATIERIATAIREGRFDPATLREIRDLVHKLAGTAGMFGDDVVSAIATDCENELAGLTLGNVRDILQHNLIRLSQAA
jgi:CheY-like chemotaxis protein/HPt (histidine-containing phosphotransfer) domain-containing protein